MYLSRYGRVDYFAWDSVDVSELHAACCCLQELLKDESGTTSLSEELR